MFTSFTQNKEPLLEAFAIDDLIATEDSEIVPFLLKNILPLQNCNVLGMQTLYYSEVYKWL